MGLNIYYTDVNEASSGSDDSYEALNVQPCLFLYAHGSRCSCVLKYCFLSVLAPADGTKPLFLSWVIPFWDHTFISTWCSSEEFVSVYCFLFRRRGASVLKGMLSDSKIKKTFKNLFKVLNWSAVRKEGTEMIKPCEIKKC